MAFVTSCEALAGTRIAQWVHHEDRYDNSLHHERTLLPSGLKFVTADWIKIVLWITAISAEVRVSEKEKS